MRKAKDFWHVFACNEFKKICCSGNFFTDLVWLAAKQPPVQPTVQPLLDAYQGGSILHLFEVLHAVCTFYNMGKYQIISSSPASIRCFQHLAHRLTGSGLPAQQFCPRSFFHKPTIYKVDIILQVLQLLNGHRFEYSHSANIHSLTVIGLFLRVGIIQDWQCV